MDGHLSPASTSPLLRKDQAQTEQSCPPDAKFPPSWDTANFCNSSGNGAHFLARRRRRTPDTFPNTLKHWLVNNQIGLAANLLLLLVLAHLSFPRARRRTRTFLQLSYFDPSTGLYTQGRDDFFYVAFWVVIFTGLRAAVVSCVLLPLAARAGLRKTKTKVRFAEQAWLLLYYSVMFPLGLYIVYNSKYWLNIRELWTEFPHRSMTGTLKCYYLMQFAFWLQQILVVNIEERRKDHWQMFTHHIITSFLILFSYGYYQTKVGTVILCLMDVVDIILPVAKMLNYTGFSTLCDLAFGAFILTWFAARHVLYLTICWSIVADVPSTMPYGCFSTVTGAKFSDDGGNDILINVLQPFIDPDGPVCFNERTRIVFLGLLLFLQGITILWFVLICRVLMKVIRGHGAEDARSDDEGEDVEDFEAEELSGEKKDVLAQVQPAVASMAEIPQQPLEEYVGVESLNLKRRSSPRYGNKSRKSGTTTGLALTGHSDRKELLGRIGCDKPT